MFNYVKWSKVMTGQVPSIGRMVHFVYGDKHFMAWITDPCFVTPEYPNGAQSLYAIPPFDATFHTVAEYDLNTTPATWHWPEYVPTKV